MELYQLQQLVVIEEYKTLSKAAEILYISQPALTRSMQKLEKELGITLFDRKKNKITLNNNGLEAVKYAKKILKEVKNMENKLTDFDLSHKTFHIGTIAPAPLWAIEYIFKNVYNYSIITHDLISYEKELIEGLNEDKYSLIILNHPLEDYESIKIFDENLYLSVPQNHEFASLKEMTLEQLNGTSVLLRSKLGYWKTIKEKFIPDSQLLYQDDEIILNELIKHSSLPGFRTNISLQRLKEKEDRIYIPFTNKEAQVTFYAIYKKENSKYYKDLSLHLSELDYSKI